MENPRRGTHYSEDPLMSLPVPEHGKAVADLHAHMGGGHSSDRLQDQISEVVHEADSTSLFVALDAAPHWLPSSYNINGAVQNILGRDNKRKRVVVWNAGAKVIYIGRDSVEAGGVFGAIALLVGMMPLELTHGDEIFAVCLAGETSVLCVSNERFQ